jgi:acetyl-CoA acetyltransferase
VHQATELVRSGAVDVALAIGVDSLSALGRGPLRMSMTEDPDAQLGILMPAVYAMRAQRFLYERDATREDLASISVQARAHGAQNPYAQFRTPVTVEEVLASRPIADPLTLLQCCPTGDGSAAVVIVSERVRRRLATVTMRVAASILHSGTFDPGSRPMLFPKITADSATDAYEQASIGPEDLDIVELHDAFTISQLLYYEAMMLCKEGDSVSFQRDGRATYGGSVVVNPSGGLLSRGHPIGATGVAQVVESLWHLRGQAGARQVPDARHALTHVTGGGIAGFDHGACTVHIFERAEPRAA